jgi:hypothetical protein
MGVRMKRPPEEIPVSPFCVDCGVILKEPFGWCSRCKAAFCFPCGHRHFCTLQCPRNGCHAGYCVREVRAGVLSSTWGLPRDQQDD